MIYNNKNRTTKAGRIYGIGAPQLPLSGPLAVFHTVPPGNQLAWSYGWRLGLVGSRLHGLPCRPAVSLWVFKLHGQHAL